MNVSTLKAKMTELWRESFHDSEKYISLVFDAYFNPDLAIYEEVQGEIVAGMLCVPYFFGNEERKLKGLYLCGLATKPHYRSRGIMTRLLTKANELALREGFAFTFLIPADEGLRKYYHDRDYVNAFYRVVDNYTSLHDFNREYESILAEQKEKVATLKRRLYASLSTGVLSSRTEGDKEEVRKDLASLIIDLETTQRDLQIIHSPKDIDVLISENIIDGGEIFYVKNSSGDTTAAAFVTFSDNVANIHKLYKKDLASKYKLLDAVKTAHPDLGIKLFVSSLEMDRKALWSRAYGSELMPGSQVPAISVAERVYSLAAHAKVYGMVRILNLYEILKFQAENQRELKYSILTKSSDVYTFDQIDVKDGVLKVKKQTADSLSPSLTSHVMSKRDIGEILFRRRDTDNMITEAFGIPSINGSICLMLD